MLGENVSSQSNMENHLDAKLREARLNSKPVLPTQCHSRPQSRLVLSAAGDWARGPRSSGDTGFDWLTRSNKIYNGSKNPSEENNSAKLVYMDIFA